MLQLKISHRLWLMALVSLVFFGVTAAIGWQGMRAARDGLKSVYENQTIGLTQLADVGALLQDSFGQVVRGFQHDPEGKLLALHNHPVTAHTDVIKANMAKIDKLWAGFMAGQHSAEELALAEEFAKKRQAWSDTLKKAADALEANTYPVEVMQNVVTKGRAQNEETSKAFLSLRDHVVGKAKQEFDAAEARYQTAQMIFLGLIVLGVLSIAALTVITVRQLGQSLKEAGDAVSAIASGDLTRDIRVRRADELGELLQKLASMQLALSELISGVTADVATVDHSAGDLAAAASRSAQTTATQSMAAVDMAASVEQFSGAIHQVEEHALAAAGVVNSTSQQSEQGRVVIQEAAEEMHRIAEAINTAAGTIQDLESLSVKVSSIVNVIREVADQTNLLALNAAIEAARAGEQGRGFAVVADEVRKLAERTSNATKDISAVIEKMQAGTARAVSEMESSVQQVTAGVALANRAGASVNEMRVGNEKVTQSISEITQTLQEQAAVAEALTRKIEVIAQGADENNANAADTASSAQELSSLAKNLRVLTSRFRVGVPGQR